MKFRDFSALWVLFFAATSGAAETRQIAIDVDGTLVQGIRSYSRTHFDAKDVLNIQIDGSGKYFVVRPYARELIASLVKRNPEVKLFFVSSDPLAKVTALLQAIKLPDGSKTFAEVASGIFTKENYPTATPEQFDLKLLGKSISETVYLTSTSSRVIPSQENNVLELGAVFYAFTTFEAAKKGADEIRDNADLWKANGPFFPTTEEQWDLERKKLARAFAVLDEALPAAPGLLLDKLSALEKESAALLSDVGARKLSGNWTLTSVRWKTTKSGEISLISGCVEVNNRTGKVNRELTLADCRAVFPTELSWVISKDFPAKVTGCLEKESDKKLLVQERPVSACLKALSHQAHWVGNKKTTCAAYVDSAFIQNVATGECSTTYFVSDEANKTTHIVNGDADFEKLTWAQVLERVRFPLPDSEHPDRLWAPYDNHPEVGFTLKDCRCSGGHCVKQDAAGALIEKCKPDTLYSWGPQVKLESLQGWMGDPKNWVNDFRPLFMTRSPVGSFGYGPVPVRIKIRPDATWAVSNNGYSACSSASADTKKNTVFFRTESLLDIVICSPAVIESWSYGTKEHYDEIIKEFRWIEANGTSGDVDLYENDGNPFDNDWDGHSFSKATFLGYLSGLFKTAQSGSGKIYFNPKTPAAKRTREAHFSTTHPIYYNEH